MDRCSQFHVVPSFDDVSKACKASSSCKSKIQPDGSFIVETPTNEHGCVDPRAVWLKQATDEDKIGKLDALLAESGFYIDVDRKCKGNRDCKIVIKANISVATFKEYKYYTDPVLVDVVVDRLKGKGYTNVSVVEADSFRSHPNFIAKNLGYKTPVINISEEPRVPIAINGKNVNLSKRMVDADFIIDMPVMKNHHAMLISGALKSMYGSLPDRDKYGLYHLKESGMGIEQVTTIVNHATPVDFIIVDMIHTQHGNEMPTLGWASPNHFKANLIAAGRDPLAIDTVFERKMGYKDGDSPIVKEERNFRGNMPAESIPILGGGLDKIPGWKSVDSWYSGLMTMAQDVTGMIKKTGFPFTLDIVERVIPKNV